MSVEVLCSASIVVDVVVVSHCDVTDVFVGTNVGLLERISGLFLVFVLFYCLTVNVTVDYLLLLLCILVER